jgi:hypothetical protein
VRPGRTRATIPAYRVLAAFALALTLALSLLWAPGLSAQEADAAREADGAADSGGAQDAAEETLPEDIRTASFYELSLWLDRLDLSTRGTRRDLEQRLFEHYGLEYTEPEPGAGGREIVIESALESSYFELTEIEQRYVRLRGGVVLRMEDPEEGVIHTIAAEELVFNRETEAITARGEIEYVIDRGTSSERFTGEQLTIYLDDWEGVFLEGTSRRDREIRGRDLEFRYSGAYITRSPDDIVTLEDGVITSSQGEPPYYRIRARKIWVLGPGEWGLQGASLYVGRVPLLYLPFFFRPGDRLFFNPVVGAKNREGAFLQTTTYLVGQKDPEESQVSVLQLAENAGEGVPREIDGLFLRPVENPGSAEVSDNTLKLLGDVYTTLGAYIGLEADYGDLGFADTLQAALGLGVSKNIYNRGGLLYSDRYVEEDGSTSVGWNSTQIGDTRLPFRYNLALDWGLSRGGLSVDTTVEWFSDPFVLQDYGDRAESMDWFSLIDPDQQVAATGGTEQGDLDWRAVGRYRSDLPGLEPYVERLDVDRLEISARWLSREIDDSDLSPEVLAADRSPEAQFYFPENLVLPSVSVTAAGTLAEGELGRGRGGRGTDDGADGADDENDENDGEEAETAPALRPPWGGDEAGEDSAPRQEGEVLRPPEIRGDLEGIVTRTPMSYRVGYSFRPTLRIDNEYLDRDWDTPEDIDFGYEYSTLTTNNSLTGTYLLGFYDRLFEVDGTLRTNGRYRDLYNEWDPDDPGIERLRTDSFDYSSLTVGNDLTVRTYPVQDNAYIGDSTLSYTLNATYFRRAYDGLDRFDDPVYSNYFIDWTTEYVSAHNIAGDLRVDYWDATQSLRVVGNLPPIDNRYDGTLTLVTGPLTSRVQTSALRENDAWIYEPLRVTETLAFGDNVSLRERFVYDIEEDRPDSSETNLKLWWLTADYRAEHALGYELNDTADTFEETEDEAFRPVEAAVGLDIDYETDPFWKRRVNLGFGINSDLRMDLQRFTQSSLDFEFSFTTRVHEFLDLSISSTSSNGLMYRYVPALADKVGVEPKNGFGDLIRSFNFFNIEDRRESDFNLKRVDVDATHYLGDWVLTFRYSGVPEQVEGDDGRDRLEWQREFAIFLEWMPIPELNTDIQVTDDDGVTYGRR